jgi:hypothetical protein
MQMEAFRMGMEQMATAVRSLAAHLRAGGQQAPAGADNDLEDADMQNLAATVQYIRDENAQAIAECKGELCRLQVRSTPLSQRHSSLHWTLFGAWVETYWGGTGF